MQSSPLIVVMGVAGSGKTRIAKALSSRTGWPMIEGDDHHPDSNRDKMASGIPLTDQDRMPWLDALARAVNAQVDGPVVLACSALNPTVRDRLAAGVKRGCRWIWLQVPEHELVRRIAERPGHFMPVSLLASQLAALDPPLDAIRLDGMQAPDAICDRILQALNE